MKSFNCNYCGKYLSEKNKISFYLRKYNSNQYEYLDFCCKGHAELFASETDMIFVNHNGHTEQEEYDYELMKKKEREEKEREINKRKIYEDKSLFDQRVKKFGSEEKYYEELTKKIKDQDGKCFIATAVYKDYNHPVVIDFRLFRDYYLVHKRWGKSFIIWYYSNGEKFSRPISRFILLRYITLIFVIKPIHLLVMLLQLYKKRKYS